MTSHQVLLIKSSWSFVAANSQEAGELFYQKLFELNPSLRVLFPENIESQANKLIGMLTYIIKHLQQIEDLTGEIHQLAARHFSYGVKPSHLIPVGQALLYALEQVNDSRWNHETSEAWQQVYALLSTSFALSLNKQPQPL
jgi:nitric oxide dioxygenase